MDHFERPLRALFSLGGPGDRIWRRRVSGTFRLSWDFRRWAVVPIFISTAESALAGIAALVPAGSASAPAPSHPTPEPPPSTTSHATLRSPLDPQTWLPSRSRRNIFTRLDHMGGQELGAPFLASFARSGALKRAQTCYLFLRRVSQVFKPAGVRNKLGVPFFEFCPKGGYHECQQ
jgi:hypothetical protein